MSTIAHRPASRGAAPRTAARLRSAALALLPEFAMASIFGSLFAGSQPTASARASLGALPRTPNA